MKKLLILLLGFIVVSCEKEDNLSYYSINNSCLLQTITTTTAIPFSSALLTEGEYFYYNSDNQLVKKVPCFVDSIGNYTYLQATDSIVYKDGYPNEAFYYYSESFDTYPYSKYYFRHEKYSFVDTKIASIYYTVYSGSAFVKNGETTFTYNGSKIISSKTIEDSYTVISYINTSYEYDNDNLIVVNEKSWEERGIVESDETYIDEDTVFTTRTYSGYNDKKNPYKDLFFVYNLREESMSENIYIYFEELTETSLSSQRSSNSYSNLIYNDKDLLEVKGSHIYSYVCD